jgi:uncharacterized protein (DUF1778 family)
MKSRSQKKDERFDLRISTEIKSLVARAAEVSGTTMSAFVIEAARERATRLIEQQERIVLNNEARDALLNVLSNPPAPNAKLRRAADKYHSEEIR